MIYNYSMGKSGPKPKSKVRIKWSAKFAYAIGLLATDGCLSTDGRHITLTSKDIKQLKNFLNCLDIKCKIGTTNNGTGQTASRVQFGDVLFFQFLESIGLMKAKSLILGKILIQDEFFFDFLRGCFDGDGCSYSYWDSRWKSSFMFYISFASGSIYFIKWIQKYIMSKIGISGHIAISSNRTNPYYQLKYAKKEGLEIVKKMYYNQDVVCLSRKYKKIQKSLIINNKQQKRYFDK